MKNLILFAALVSTLIIASCGGEKKSGSATTIDSMTVTKTTTSTTIDSMTVKPK